MCDLFKRDIDSLPEGAVEQNSLYTAKIHMNHVMRLIGRRFEINCLKLSTLQKYVNSRSKEKGRRNKRISPTTIHKELTTFSGVWSWARQAELIGFDFPKRGLKYPKTSDKTPFQTWQEIETQIERGALTAIRQPELWDCLYLNRSEVSELLAFVSEAARHDFIHPMVTMAAYTGARRSELVRSQMTDIDLDNSIVRIREQKRARGRHTFRTIPMSGQLRSVLMEWFQKHPGGPHTFCIRRDALKTKANGSLSVDQAHDRIKRTLRGDWKNIRGWHVFRHSFISNCTSQGVDQRMIDTWSGHQTEEMRLRYTHLFPDQQQLALDSVFGEVE